MRGDWSERSERVREGQDMRRVGGGGGGGGGNGEGGGER